MPRVIVLGSGTPAPSPVRWGTSFLVEIGEEWLMFDCGPAATYSSLTTIPITTRTTPASF